MDGGEGGENGNRVDVREELGEEERGEGESGDGR